MAPCHMPIKLSISRSMPDSSANSQTARMASYGDRFPTILDEVAALKRERTIEAAAQLFYERGYEKTTLEAVADQLGVTKPFIYLHFKSKAELLAEICSRGVRASLQALDAAMALDASPTRKLEQLSRDFLTVVLNHQRHIAILTREEKSLEPHDFQRLSSERRAFDSKLAQLLMDGVKAGDFVVSDPNVASLAIGGLVSWAYIWYRPHGRLSLDALADEVTGLVLAMVGVAPRARR